MATTNQEKDKSKSRRQPNVGMNILNPGEIVIGPQCRYTVMEQVGVGKSCKVYSAENEKGDEFALKVFKAAPNSSSTMYRELQFSMFLKNSSCYFVETYDAINHGQKDILSQELLSGSLPDIKCSLNATFISPWLIQTLALHLLGGLVHMERCNIIHGDIKPQNVMWDGNTETFKLIDFGLSYSAEDINMKHSIQSLPYRAPESIVWNAYTWESTKKNKSNPLTVPQRPSFAADLWSVGCVLAEVMIGKRLFYRGYVSDLDISNHLDKISAKVQKNYNEKVFKKIWHVVEQCIIVNPDKRPQALDILQKLRTKFPLEIPSRQDNYFLPKKCVCLTSFIQPHLAEPDIQRGITWAKNVCKEMDGFIECKEDRKSGGFYIVLKSTKYSEKAYLAFTKLSLESFIVIPMFYSLSLYKQGLFT